MSYLSSRSMPQTAGDCLQWSVYHTFSYSIFRTLRAMAEPKLISNMNMNTNTGVETRHHCRTCRTNPMPHPGWASSMVLFWMNYSSGRKLILCTEHFPLTALPVLKQERLYGKKPTSLSRSTANSTRSSKDPTVYAVA